MTIRPVLILFVLASTPAFCQDSLNDLSGGLKQRLADILRNKQIQSLGVIPANRLFASAQFGGSGLCSIPLLSVAAPGKPVPMPNMVPKANPEASGTLDRMKIVAPAPACTSAMPGVTPNVRLYSVPPSVRLLPVPSTKP